MLIRTSIEMAALRDARLDREHSQRCSALPLGYYAMAPSGSECENICDSPEDASRDLRGASSIGEFCIEIAWSVKPWQMKRI